MADGAVKAEWARTSSVMALIANCHRDPEKEPIDADYFNPTKQREPEPPPPKVDIGVLKSVFMRKGRGG